MSEEGDISSQELKSRVVYSLLLSAVKLANLFGMPLKDVTGWVETAYFREVRSRGGTLKETALQLGVSQRTAVRLSKQLRESFFFLPEVSHNLQRRLEFMLGAQPMGVARLKQVMPEVEPEQIEASLESLLSQGRILEVPGRTMMYRSASNMRHLPRDTWMSRIGGLNSFVENLASATYGRFFKQEDKTFARTVSFSVRPEDLPRLEALYAQHLLTAIKELDAEAEGHDDKMDMQASLCWAPYEFLQAEALDENSTDQ